MLEGSNIGNASSVVLVVAEVGVAGSGSKYFRKK